MRRIYIACGAVWLAGFALVVWGIANGGGR